MPYMLAAQVASMAIGSGMSYMASRKQKRQLNERLQFGKKLLEAGGQMERSQLDLRLQEEQLAFTEQSIQDAQSLRETLASQNAFFAFRGQMAGAGSAQAISQDAIYKYGYDQTARQMSFNFLKTNINTAKELSFFNQAASGMDLVLDARFKKSQISSAFKKNLFDNSSGVLMAGLSSMGKGTGKAPKPINYSKNAGKASAMRALKNLGDKEFLKVGKIK